MNNLPISDTRIAHNPFSGIWDCTPANGPNARGSVVVAPYGATFHINPESQAYAVETGSRIKHAFVHIDYADIWDDVEAWRNYVKATPNLVRVHYNLSRAPHFVCCDSGKRVESCKSLVMIAVKGESPEVWAVL